MIDVELEAKEFEENRGDSLALSTQKNRDLALRRFEYFCEVIYEMEPDDLIGEIMKNHDAGYNTLKKFKNYELEKRVALSTIKLRIHYVRRYFSRHGIKLDDKEKLKGVIGKLPKHRREAVTHDNLELICNNANHKLKSLVLVQSSSGLRVSEMLGLKVKDVTKLERYQIKVRAENAKMKVERITFVSKETEPYLEYFLKDKKPNDLVFDYSRSAMTTALQNVLIKVGLGKRYDHSNHRLISTHSFRAFFITQMGKVEGFFGHALAGHDHYMANYDRYTPDELLEKYIEGESKLQIFDRVNEKQIKNMERRLEEQQKTIERLEQENKYRDDMFRTADQATKNKITQLLFQAEA